MSDREDSKLRGSAVVLGMDSVSGTFRVVSANVVQKQPLHTMEIS